MIPLKEDIFRGPISEVTLGWNRGLVVIITFFKVVPISTMIEPTFTVVRDDTRGLPFDSFFDLNLSFYPS